MVYKFHTPFTSKNVINTVHRAIIQLSNCSYFLPFFGEQQKDLLEAMDYAQSTPSLSQAQRIKKLAQENKITAEGMEIILSEEKKQDLDRVTLKRDTLKKYFPKSYTPKMMEDQIIKLLQQWQKKRDRDMSL